MVKVIETWNKTFDRMVEVDNENHIEMIDSALNVFSAEQLCKAIFRRSQDSYYRTIPWHRDNPEMFFPIPRYIRNDLKRKPEGVYTFEEMTDKVGETPGMTTDSFEMIPEMKDDRDRPLWKLKVSNM